MSDVHSAEIDALRQEHNAAVANGMLLFARQIARRIEAMERARVARVIPSGSAEATS